MKQLFFSPSNTPVLLSCMALIFLVFFSSCDPVSRVTNNNNTHLDPVVGKNTNPKDTSNTGTYKPVTTVNNDPKIDTITWCDTIPQTIFKRIVVCYKKVGNKTVKADTVAVLEINNDAIYVATKIDSTIQRKLAYKVAIIMPFMSNGFVPNPQKEVPSRSVKAVEFYEGVLLALDSLKAEGVSLFVNVFDTQRDSAVVESLLKQKELLDADLILGPVTSKSLEIVARFAKEHQKPLISPFNSRPDLTTDNPYYIQINPSFEVHSKYIVNFLHKIESDNKLFRTPLEKNLFMLSLAQDSFRTQAVQKSFAAYKNDIDAKIPELVRKDAFIDVEDIKPFLKRDQLNIIVMPSYQNEGFIYNSLREIQKLVDKVEPKKGYQIAVIGMDSWKYYTRVNFEYFESLNVHLSSEYFTDLEDKKVQAFRDNYKAVYGIGAREFGNIGYDVMLYFGRMMQQYGINFQSHLWKAPRQYGHTKFQIEPSYEVLVPLDGSADQTPKKVIRSYENQYLNFLKFENYSLQKMN